MAHVCIITGGGSGIGLATAYRMKEYDAVVISGRSEIKLEAAAQELREHGVSAEIFSCDVSDQVQVRRLAEYAEHRGSIKTVIHAAGISPEGAEAWQIFDTNAIGTMYVNETFLPIMDAGGCIVNISSMSAYLLPYLLLKSDRMTQDYSQSLSDAQAFRTQMLSFFDSLPEGLQRTVAYALSKDFVIGYSTQCACQYGKQRIRVLSVSPGTFDTPMGRMGGEHFVDYALNGALGRIGHPNEIAQLLKFCSSDIASYLTGTDILYDGGAIAALKQSFQALLPTEQK